MPGWPQGVTVQACPTQAWVQLAGFCLLVFAVPPVPWGLCWAWGESKGYKWMARGTMGPCASLGGHEILGGHGSLVVCLGWGGWRWAGGLPELGEGSRERVAGGGPWDPPEACSLCSGSVRGRLSFGLAWGWLAVASVPSVPRARQDRKEGHAGTVGEGGDRCRHWWDPPAAWKGCREAGAQSSPTHRLGAPQFPGFSPRHHPPNLGF